MENHWLLKYTRPELVSDCAVCSGEIHHDCYVNAQKQTASHPLKNRITTKRITSAAGELTTGVGVTKSCHSKEPKTFNCGGRHSQQQG